MFNDFKLIDDRPVYIQLKNYLKEKIMKGHLLEHQKLPSTRELSKLLLVSRNTILNAYADLEQEGIIYAIKGKGNFVGKVATLKAPSIELKWKERLNKATLLADELDLMKQDIHWEKGMISFNSVAPEEKLFDVENFKRAFLTRMSLEGDIVLNYGYAKGYKPLIEYLLHYMEMKGVDISNKDILITNGFTEGLDILLSSLAKKSGRVICENPTHHAALKLFRLHGFDIHGIDMKDDGIDIEQVERSLSEKEFDFAYLIPSYHNPTGIVTSSEKRAEIIKLFSQYQIPIVEDGFNEELRYSGSHLAPLMTFIGEGNNVIYISSFSKVLFPGLRVGWILADKELINCLESMKRARTIHTSTLDQAVLYQYLQDGYFEKYLKKAKFVYKKKYELARQACHQYIPFKRMTGDGGLHLFIELEEGMNARTLLEKCYLRGVVFYPGDVFYSNGEGSNTFRLGFSRLTEEDIVSGIKIIGDTLKNEMGS
ncbi:GntR family transcriptional regulator [Lysinibacillus sphaericus]|uniref:MocR-like pyridoxine biosynthesis transcription factor PdxR n=1 Tax=Lysinibacillus sphaericus TaxID=1421 RepID=UPI0018CDB5A4|nr:PLP-dependent aminotransferase family protein [Lysinibacillus sphaericus]MBG9455606.1 GntR family transcriptional regulator [Lysinibacillus sphaericus]MBG9478023.1 GntR family transcriptional regulator [Lysinibacillus sphaericus]MBG9594163.1 GntR family transcriptional regulator [Lysinibacillus sphaericus]